MQEKYSTKQVADLLNIDKSTLLRWIKQGKIPDVKQRDGRNWRVWLPEDLEHVRLYHDKIHQLSFNLAEGADVEASSNSLSDKKGDSLRKSS